MRSSKAFMGLSPSESQAMRGHFSMFFNFYFTLAINLVHKQVYNIKIISILCNNSDPIFLHSCYLDQNVSGESDELTLSLSVEKN